MDSSSFVERYAWDGIFANTVCISSLDIMRALTFYPRHQNVSLITSAGQISALGKQYIGSS